MEQCGSFSSILLESLDQVDIVATREKLDHFQVYYDELFRWNRKVNLTGLSDVRDIAVNLFVDSLVTSRVCDFHDGMRVMDVGSGAGFPGIPLKILYPELTMTLVEPKKKKAAFLHHVIGHLSLDRICVVTESLRDIAMRSSSAAYEIIVSKALNHVEIFPHLGSLIHSGSRVVLFRSERNKGLDIPGGFELEREVCYQLPYGYGRRAFAVIRPQHA